jgi:hypothetical protein
LTKKPYPKPWLSLLEADASQSVEKMYEVSTETTIKSRDQLYEFTEFLSDVEHVLHPYCEHDHVGKLLEKVGGMRQIGNDYTAATTDMTITLSDLLKSLHGQSSDLSDISNTLLQQISRFKL